MRRQASSLDQKFTIFSRIIIYQGQQIRIILMNNYAIHLHVTKLRHLN
jgi:hypothetical protein